MRYNWIRDREIQKQFKIYWDYGKNNEGDFPTKHHGPGYHLTMRQRYLLRMNLMKTFLESFLPKTGQSRREGVLIPYGLSGAGDQSPLDKIS